MLNLDATGRAARDVAVTGPRQRPRDRAFDAAAARLAASRVRAAASEFGHVAGVLAVLAAILAIGAVWRYLAITTVVSALRGFHLCLPEVSITASRVYSEGVRRDSPDAGELNSSRSIAAVRYRKMRPTCAATSGAAISPSG